VRQIGRRLFGMGREKRGGNRFALYHTDFGYDSIIKTRRKKMRSWFWEFENQQFVVRLAGILLLSATLFCVCFHYTIWAAVSGILFGFIFKMSMPKYPVSHSRISKERDGREYTHLSTTFSLHLAPWMSTVLLAVGSACALTLAQLIYMLLDRLWIWEILVYVGCALLALATLRVFSSIKRQYQKKQLVRK
jgi:hypothetical protein